MITNERFNFLWNFCCWILVLDLDCDSMIKAKLSGLDLTYKSGCDCEFCMINRCTYQRLIRKIFGRYETKSGKQLFMSSYYSQEGND